MSNDRSQSQLSRRAFVHMSALNALAAMACRKVPTSNGVSALTGPVDPKNFGPLVSNLNAPLELPAGFHCAVVQQFHELMSCGNRMPAQPDGMTCHVDEHGQYVLLRNHEMGDGRWMSKPGRALPTNYFRGGIHPEEAYDKRMFGGVTRVVLHPEKLLDVIPSGDARTAVVSSNLVLAGTQYNCSGGHVDEGWITCEESDDPDHGYAFLTKIEDDALVDATQRRITSWGRMKREGVSLEPNTGFVYMTEDHKNGRLYRFVPDAAGQPMGAGTLEALKIDGTLDTDPETPLTEGQSWSTSWVTIADPQAEHRPCREQGEALGASRFNRCEGSVIVGDSLWFIASTAGPVGAGQIFRLDLRKNTLHLEVQVTDRSTLSMPDNVTLTPWGDLLMAEDNYNTGGGATHQYLRCLRPDGSIYDFARNPHNSTDDCGAELTGPCFSPDGTVLFVNIQAPVGATVAITGPWDQV